MTNHPPRIAREAGCVRIKNLPKGPNGRYLCRRCNVEVPIGRRTFCSDACVHEWKIRTQPSYVREVVFNRDHGICRICGFLEKTWQADHIVPVAEGGGQCGLDGYRTLCRACHARETGLLRRRLNAAKKAAKQDSLFVAEVRGGNMPTSDLNDDSLPILTKFAETPEQKSERERRQEKRSQFIKHLNELAKPG